MILSMHLIWYWLVILSYPSLQSSSISQSPILPNKYFCTSTFEKHSSVNWSLSSSQTFLYVSLVNLLSLVNSFQLYESYLISIQYDFYWFVTHFACIMHVHCASESFFIDKSFYDYKSQLNIFENTKYWFVTNCIFSFSIHPFNHV